MLRTCAWLSAIGLTTLACSGASSAPFDTTSPGTPEDDAAPPTSGGGALAADGGANEDATDAGRAQRDAPADAARDADADVVDATLDAPAPYRHTIVIDGTNDFDAANEAISTTTSTYQANVAWDATALYVGYTGNDLQSGATQGENVLLVYLDVDPGSGSGSSVGEAFSAQTPAFPVSFGADVQVTWNPATETLSEKRFASGSWNAADASGVELSRSGNYVEMKIPLEGAARVGLVTLMMYTHPGAEWSYAGLYSGSFGDGRYGTVPIGQYLIADLASAETPNSPSAHKP